MNGYPPIQRLVSHGSIPVDLGIGLPQLPERGGDVLAVWSDRSAGGGFNVLSAAVRLGLSLQAQLAQTPATQGLRLRVGIHTGPAMVATINDHLDYFGTTARLAGTPPFGCRAAADVGAAAALSVIVVIAGGWARGATADRAARRFGRRRDRPAETRHGRLAYLRAACHG